MDILLFIIGLVIVGGIFLLIQKRDAIEDGEKPIIDVLKEKADLIAEKFKKDE